MSRPDRLRVLLASCGFGELGLRALRDLASWFDEVSVRPGTTIMVEGRPAHELIVVAEGTLSVRRSKDASAREVGPGATIGWAAMEMRGAHDATVVASSEARLLVMSHAQFRAALGARDSQRKARLWPLPTSRRPLPHGHHLEGA